MGAYAEHEQPMLRRHGGGASRRGDPAGDDDCAKGLREFCLYVCITAVVGALLAPLVWYVIQSSMSPEYSVAITAVSGLDPATDLRPGRGVTMLNPVFNLTVGIASRNALAGGCINPGTSIKVSYLHPHRLPMASGRAPDMCVEPEQSAGPRAAVARGHDVAVPGFLLDSLAEDTRRGEAVFEVLLTGLASPREWSVVTCWVRVGEGAGGAALDMRCDQSWRGIDRIPEEDSGHVPRALLAARTH